MQGKNKDIQSMLDRASHFYFLGCDRDSSYHRTSGEVPSQEIYDLLKLVEVVVVNIAGCLEKHNSSSICKHLDHHTPSHWVYN